MITDLQKASLWKRISAALFDGILLSIVAVGIAVLLSMIFGYNDHIDELANSYSQYESRYGVQFQITEEQYQSMTQEQQANYDAAYKALTADADVIRIYNVVLNMTLLIITFAILIGVLIVEFTIPLFLGNGQTLGKKVFGVALMHAEGIRISTLQLFVRTVLGKFTFELMIPIYIIIMIGFNSIGLVGILVLAALVLSEVICLVRSKTGSLLHDSLAGTVAVDMASQMIFKDRDELLAYIAKVHAERAAHSDY